MTNDSAIETEIVAKGLVAPRVTLSDIGASVASEHYFTAAKAVSPDVPLHGHDPLSTLTFCVLVLRNGFTVTGESACASPENFDFDLGCKIARRHAEAKIWPLLGYALRDALSRTP